MSVEFVEIERPSKGSAMQVRQLMTSKVEVVPPSATLRDAAMKMKQRDIGAIPVQQNGHVIGIVTDRDITIRAVAEGLDPKATRVSDVMTEGVTVCRDSDDVDTLMEIMENQQIRRVVVLNDNDKLVGICSLGDLALAMGESGEDASGEVLREVSRQDHPTV